MSHLRIHSQTGSNNAAYLVVLAGVCAALHVWKLPPALPELQKQLGLSLVESGFLLSLVQIGGMTLGLMVGLIAEKIGLRRCALIGLFLLGTASAMGAVFDNKTALLAFRGMEGCGFLMVTMPAPALIRRLVDPSYLSRVLGVWGCYIPTGTVIVLLGGSWVLSVSDWRVLWWLLAGVTAIMLGLVWRLIPPDSKSHVHSTPALGESVPSSWDIVKTTLSSPNVWLVALSFGAYSGQWIAVIGFMPSIYSVAGIAGPTAGILTAIVGGSNAIGNLAAGRLLHRGFRPQTLLCTGFITMGISAFVAFALGLSATWQFFAVLVFSAVGGLVPTTLFLLAIQLAPSPRTTSTSIGWLQQCSALGQFLGPPVVAWVATVMGGWQGTWLVTGACAAAGIWMSVRLGLRNQLKGHVG